MFVLQKLKLVWTRITFSRLTLFYFIFSILHFALQVAFQTYALYINANAADFLWDVVTQGDASVRAAGTFPVLDDDLRLCNTSRVEWDQCQVIWPQNSASGNTYDYDVGKGSVSEAKVNSTVATSTESTASTPTSVNNDSGEEREDDGRVTAIELATNGGLNLDGLGSDLTLTLSRRQQPEGVALSFVEVDGQVQVVLSGQGYSKTPALLDRSCLWALNYPVGILQNTKREDIVFLCFHFWVLGMSIVALLNESIPHILASLATHVGATAWAGFQLAHTARFRSNFARVITNGACATPEGVDADGFLLGGYWVERSKAEIPILALNVLGLGISVLLTWKLVKSFGWQTFKRVGASLHISRIYKFVLTLSITIQLSVFFMGATVGLWLDQLWNGPIGRLASFKQLYQIVFIIVGVLLIPWLMTGWFAVRRELKIPMLIFLILDVGYFAGWGAMFLSDAFRWTFVQWMFFSIMASASVLLTLAAFILGLICRWNFDRGLPRYLNGDQTLSDKDEFINAPPLLAQPGADRDIEKVAFPSRDTAIPTYAAAYDAPAPPYGAMGPRFFNHSSAPSFDQQYPTINTNVSGMGVGYHHRSPSQLSSVSGHSSRSPQSVITPPGSTYASPIDGSRRGVVDQFPQLHRFNSNSSSSSHMSSASSRSKYAVDTVTGKRTSRSSTNSAGADAYGGKKRQWVIE